MLNSVLKLSDTNHWAGLLLQCGFQSSDVLVRVSIAVERHHNQRNFYKGQHLIGAGLQFQTFNPLSSWREAWRYTGRHDTREGAKSFIS